MQQGFTVDGLANVRDLGGRERNDGTLTPHNVFIRAERLDRVTRTGWRQLEDYGVRTVIDLRRPHERNGEVPNTFQRINVDVDGDDSIFWAPFEADGRWGTPLYYRAHLAEIPQRLAAVMREIASADEGGILFHCNAGWDRTGLVAAVLLRAVNATPGSATADYLASFDNADAMGSLHERSFEVPERRYILAQFGHTPESAFRDAYEHLDLETWFEAADIDSETLRAIMTWRGATAG